MLISMKLTGSAQNLAAYHAKEENYYFAQAGGVEAMADASGSAQGHVLIHGKLASTLGFTDGQSISQQDLENLLSGRNSSGARVSGAQRVLGIDLTFSAPKSVSVAGLLLDRDPKIIAAHDRAVLDTMCEIEKFCASTRTGKDGVNRVQTGNLAYVTVRDGFNRDHDPHLHTHVVVMNMTQLGESILTLDGRQIMRQDFNKMWGTLYRQNLAAHLREAGYGISYTKKGELRMDAVSLALEREFSQRRRAIVDAKEKGIRDMAAWRATRAEKNPEIEKADVLASWRERADRHRSRTAAQTRAETVADRDNWYRQAKWSLEAKQELAGERGRGEAAFWQTAIRRATEECAAVTKDALIREYITERMRAETWEVITYAEASWRLAQEVSSARIIRTDDGRYTSWEMAQADRECLKFLGTRKVLRQDVADFQVREYNKTQEALNLRHLSSQQAAAAAAVLAADRGVVVVQGDAGAGKTTMLKAVNDIGVREGWEIVGLAVQGVAARKLQEESGIKSRTIASYLAAERAASRKRELTGADADRTARLLVLDEASMLNSRGLAQLLASAEAAGDKVVLVGDRNQVQSVGAGRPFDHLVERAEAAGQLVSLTENFRQKDAELLQAVTLARAGNMRDSLDVLARGGRVTELDDRRLRQLAVASRYNEQTLILTGGREGRDSLNALIREDLLARGALSRSSARSFALSWADDDGVKQTFQREIAVGEVVTFLENEYRQYDVRNGERGHVMKVAGDILTIGLEDGRTVELDTRRYGALDYGYAMTTYKAQGQTYDQVVIDADTSVAQLQDQRNTYVQITRARHDVQIFTDDKADLRESAGVLNFKADTLGVSADLETAVRMARRIRARVFGGAAGAEVAGAAEKETPPAVELTGGVPATGGEKAMAEIKAGDQSAPGDEGYTSSEVLGASNLPDEKIPQPTIPQPPPSPQAARSDGTVRPNVDLVYSPYFDSLALEAEKNKWGFGKDLTGSGAFETIHPRVMAEMEDFLGGRGSAAELSIFHIRDLLDNMGVVNFTLSDMKDEAEKQFLLAQEISKVALDAPPKTAIFWKASIVRNLERYHLATGEPMVPMHVVATIAQLDARIAFQNTATEAKEALRENKEQAKMQEPLQPEGRMEPVDARRDIDNLRRSSLIAILERFGSTRDAEQSSRHWHTPIGRVELDGNRFFAYDRGTVGVDAINLVMALTDSSFADAVVKLQSLGALPAAEPVAKMDGREEHMDTALTDAARDLAEKMQAEGAAVGDTRTPEKIGRFTNPSIFLEFSGDKNRLSYYGKFFKELEKELETASFPEKYKQQIADVLGSPPAMKLFTQDLSVREIIATAAAVECRLQPSAVLPNITEKEKEHVADAAAELRASRREMKNLHVFETPNHKFVIATSAAAANVSKDEMDRHYTAAVQSHQAKEQDSKLAKYAYLAHPWRATQEFDDQKDAVKALHRLDFTTRAEQVAVDRAQNRDRGLER